MAKTAETPITLALPKALRNYLEAQEESPDEYLARLLKEDRDRKRDQLEDELVAALDQEAVRITEEDFQSGEGLMAIMRRKLAARGQK
jgi:hypothetical protein